MPACAPPGAVTYAASVAEGKKMKLEIMPVDGRSWSPRSTPRRKSYAAPPKRCADSIKDVGVHGQDARVDAAIDTFRFVVVPRGAEREEKRQEMLVGRMRARAMGRARAIVGKRFDVMRLQPLAHPFAELARVRLLLSRAAHPVTQVVRHMARADDEDIVLLQLAQRAPERQMMARPELGLQRHLHHRYVGVRVHVKERRPSAVVEAAHAVDRGGEARFL